MEIVIGGIFGVIHLLLFLIALYEIVTSSKTIPLKLVWGLVIFFFPCIGLIVYYFFGRT